MYSTPHPITDTLTESWHGFGRVRDFDFRILEEVALFKSGIEAAAFNYAYAAKDISDETATRIAEYFGKTPFSWIVDNEHSLTRHLLEERGFSLEESWAGMIMDLSKLDDETPYSHIETCLVSNPSTLNHWIHIVTEGFNLSNNCVAAFARPLAALDDQRFFVAYVDGEPASACIVSICRDAAFLAYVVTIPEKRRRGVGKALTAFSLADARRQGCVRAALQSSEMAEAMYRGIGFEKVRDYKLWGTCNG